MEFAVEAGGGKGWPIDATKILYHANQVCTNSNNNNYYNVSRSMMGKARHGDCNKK